MIFLKRTPLLRGWMINADKHIPPKTIRITKIDKIIPFHCVFASSSSSYKKRFVIFCQFFSFYEVTVKWNPAWEYLSSSSLLVRFMISSCMSTMLRGASVHFRDSWYNCDKRLISPKDGEAPSWLSRRGEAKVTVFGPIRGKVSLVSESSSLSITDISIY